MVALYGLLPAGPVPAAPTDRLDTDRLDSPDAIAGAARAMAKAAKDRLLVKDLLGRKLQGPDGQPLGTVDNLAVIPGGRIVAALVTLPDGTRLALPFNAVTLATSAQGVQATVPATAEQLKGMPALVDLAGSLTGGP